MRRNLVNALSVSGDPGTDIVTMLRNKFRCTLGIVQADDATLVLAHTAWRLADGRNWQTLPDYLSADVRRASYRNAREVYAISWALAD